MNKPNPTKSEQLLTRFSLKKTDLRLSLLDLFLKEKRSYTQAEILEHLEKRKQSVDRVSVYRNLNQLKAAGIVHEIENNKYVGCNHDCEKHAHVLLYCLSCEKHSEVKDHEKLNQFFKAIENFHFLSPSQAVFLKGLCQACAHV
ncbi:MAG TPA: transcriptional repressor [Pseudobdellovibrionaceae bacterium]|nr:transcriptional repressor [Pseudobdellovibrionaceae bacterium]